MSTPVVYGCPACGIRSWAEKGGSRHWPSCRYYGDNSWPGRLVPTAPATASAAVTVLPARIPSPTRETYTPENVSSLDCPRCGAPIAEGVSHIPNACRQRKFRAAHRVTA